MNLRMPVTLALFAALSGCVAAAPTNPTPSASPDATASTAPSGTDASKGPEVTASAAPIAAADLPPRAGRTYVYSGTDAGVAETTKVVLRNASGEGFSGEILTEGGSGNGSMSLDMNKVNGAWVITNTDDGKPTKDLMSYPEESLTLPVGTFTVHKVEVTGSNGAGTYYYDAASGIELKSVQQFSGGTQRTRQLSAIQG